MTKTSLSDSHSKLIIDWKTARPYYDFCHDGILDESRWHETTPKILFLLKESNSDFKNIGGRGHAPDGKSMVFWDTDKGLNGWGPNGASKVFWRNINIWQYVATEFWNKRTPDQSKIKMIKEKQVNSIAYVNIKKNAENKPISNNNEIYEYAVNDKDFLVRQIVTINPEVIFCCGTINSLKAILQPDSLADNLYIFNNKLIIDVYHPSCRTSYNKTFNKLTWILSKADWVKILNKEISLMPGS